MHVVRDGAGYFARVISYEPKMFMRLAIGVNFINILRM
jgi:hypothetical protein